MARQPLTIEHALLGFLRQGPLHGYAIHRCMAQPGGPGQAWRLKQSQLYALLSRLERAGYVAAKRAPQAGRRPRRLFRLTPAGRKVFSSWLSSPVEHPRDMRQGFLLKLYFAEQEGAAKVLELIDRQSERCREWLAGLKARRQTESSEPGYQGLVRAYRIGQIEAMLSWLRSSRTHWSTHSAVRWPGR
ncbi:MAG: PadR family transcriptional regulator [Chloroflexota bacterium]